MATYCLRRCQCQSERGDSFPKQLNSYRSIKSQQPTDALIFRYLSASYLSCIVPVILSFLRADKSSKYNLATEKNTWKEAPVQSYLKHTTTSPPETLQWAEHIPTLCSEAVCLCYSPQKVALAPRFQRIQFFFSDDMCSQSFSTLCFLL